MTKLRKSATRVTLDGKRFVILPESEFKRLVKANDSGYPEPLPPWPAPLADGNYPAIAYARVSLARDIIQARQRMGWSPSELARRAGVSARTLDQIEKAKTTAGVAVVKRLDCALLMADVKPPARARRPE